MKKGSEIFYFLFTSQLLELGWSFVDNQSKGCDFDELMSAELHEKLAVGTWKLRTISVFP